MEIKVSTNQELGKQNKSRDVQKIKIVRNQEIGKTFDNSKISRSKLVRNSPILPVPKYIKHLVDNPRVERLSGIVRTDRDIFQQIQELNVRLAIPSTGLGVFEYIHGLGYRPLVRGSYTIISGDTTVGTAFPIGLCGLIPEDRYPEYGLGTIHSAQVTTLDEDSLRLSVSMSGFEGEVGVKLLLYRERTV